MVIVEQKYQSRPCGIAHSISQVVTSAWSEMIAMATQPRPSKGAGKNTITLMQLPLYHITYALQL